MARRARYRLEIARTAEKQLRRLPKDAQRRVVAAMQALATDPRPPVARKLTGYEDVYRIRVGIYRIIYSVSGRAVIVTILKVGHRRDVYR